MSGWLRWRWTLAVVLQVFQHLAFADKKLIFSHLAWRHGDRSPSISFPTDTENPESSWPQGWGELTQEGMRQHYKLGQYIRERYTDFLSPNYSQPEVNRLAFWTLYCEIHIRSTSYNRTIMSAMADMAGLFPPAVEWEKGLPWQPVPIHSRPREEDPMLWMEYPCPVETELYFNGVMKSAEVQKIMEEHKELLDTLREKTGLGDEGLKTLDDIWKVYDPLYCEKQHAADGHSWPAWVTEDLFANISTLHDLSTSFYYKTPKIQRLRGGLLLDDIINRMRFVIENSPRLKLYVYSSHDTTLIALLSILGAFNNHVPPYAAAVFIELYQDGNQHLVELYYKNSTGDPHSLEIEGCPQPCTLDALSERSKSLIPTNYKRECGSEGFLDQISRDAWIGIFTLLCATVTTLSIVLIFLIAKLRRVPSGGIQYRPVPADDSSINGLFNG